jgi:hypothetical protein
MAPLLLAAGGCHGMIVGFCCFSVIFAAIDEFGKRFNLMFVVNVHNNLTYLDYRNTFINSCFLQKLLLMN